MLLAVPGEAGVPAPPRSPDGSVQISPSATPPQLVFASDTPTEKLHSLFTPSMIADLKDLHAGIALAISDFSPERAQLVRDLTAAGVPVTAWLVLATEQGYYFNVSNAPEAAVRFNQFQAWTAAQNLHWSAVGLDIEPKLDELQGSKWHMARTIFRRAFDAGRVERARQAYASLVRTMKGAGYTVQTYQMIFLADERKAHSTMLERTLGLVDVRGDDEVLMIYSSFNHAAGAALIWSYGPDTQTVAVGSTALSGSADLDARFPPLNWDEFSRDLLVASHFSHMVGIYSLEGCVQQGFLPRLKTMRWDQTITIPADHVKTVIHFRHFAFGVLWVASHGLWILAALLVAIFGFIWRRRSLRERLAEQSVAAGGISGRGASS
jgi:hypothetical protein